MTLCDKCDDRRDDSSLQTHGSSGQGEQMLPDTTGQGGFPEMVRSTLRSEGGIWVNQTTEKEKEKNFPDRSISTC